MSRAAAWRSQPLSFNLIILSANFSGVNPATWDGTSVSASPMPYYPNQIRMVLSLYRDRLGRYRPFLSYANRRANIFSRIVPKLSHEFNMRDYINYIKNQKVSTYIGHKHFNNSANFYSFNAKVLEEVFL